MSSSPVLALGAEHYISAETFAREQERLFRRTWQYAGHCSQLESPGDYFTFTLHGRSLFCVRGRDGEVRSFYNVCMHRAHQLVEGRGNKRVLVCPYHAWTYELNGRLRGAPATDQMPGFDADRICLNAVRTEILGGFIFVNLDPQAKPMAAWYPDLASDLEEFLPQLDRLKPVYTREVEERCNWKISVENYNECYHCRLNHPTFSSGVVDPESYDIVPRGHLLRHVTKSAAAESLTYEVDPDSHPRALEYSSWFMWPCFSFQVYPGNVLNTYLWRAVDHRTTLVVRQWLGVDGVESDALYRLAEQDLNTTVAEDVRLVESVQRGMESGGYRPSPLVINPRGGLNSEHSIHAIYGWLAEALAA